jgi:hypothetical protein
MKANIKEGQTRFDMQKAVVIVHAAHDREHDCYNSFTLCKGCTHSPRVVIVLG